MIVSLSSALATLAWYAAFSLVALSYARRTALAFAPWRGSSVAVAACAAIWSAIPAVAASGWQAPALLAAAACAAATDLQNGHIFDWVLLAAAAPCLAIAAMHGTTIDAIAGGAIAAALLAMPWLLTRGRGMGLGDLKLGALLGLGLGSMRATHAVWFAFVAGGALAAVLWCAGVVRRDTRLPFGPFLAAGACWALAW